MFTYFSTEEQKLNVKEGTKVLGLYIGSFQAEGIVVGSRVKYGACKQYLIELTKNMHNPWSADAYKAGECVNVLADELVGFYDDTDESKNLQYIA